MERDMRLVIVCGNFCRGLSILNGKALLREDCKSKISDASSALTQGIQAEN